MRLLPAHEGAGLEEAQVAKLERICERLRLGPDNHLLEIGTGWGGLAVHAAREHGCRVTTTTISREQHAAGTAAGARGRPRGAGRRCCSRTTATWRGSYDRAGLGRDDRGGRLAALRRVLPPLRRAARPRRADAAAGDHDRRPPLRDGEGRPQLRQHPRLPRRLPALERAIADCLQRVTSMRPVWAEDITAHYPPTLAAWRERFFGRLGPAPHRAAMTSASADSGPSTSAPRRRASASGGSATCRRYSPSRDGVSEAGAERRCVLLHGLGASRQVWDAGARSAQPRARGARPRPARLRRGRRPSRRGRAERRKPGAPRSMPAARSSGSSDLTSPATRSAAGSALEMGRAGWAASVTALSPAGLWRQPLGRPARGLTPLGTKAATAGRAWPFARAGAREAMLATFAAHPAQIPAGIGPRAGPRLDRRQAATTAPTRRCAPTSSNRLAIPRCAGDDRLGRARPPGRPTAARAPAGRRPLPRPSRSRPHADVGRPGAGRPDPAGVKLGAERRLKALSAASATRFFWDSSGTRATRKEQH